MSSCLHADVPGSSNEGLRVNMRNKKGSVHIDSKQTCGVIEVTSKPDMAHTRTDWLERDVKQRGCNGHRGALHR